MLLDTFFEHSATLLNQLNEPEQARRAGGGEHCDDNSLLADTRQRPEPLNILLRYIGNLYGVMAEHYHDMAHLARLTEHWIDAIHQAIKRGGPGTDQLVRLLADCRQTSAGHPELVRAFSEGTKAASASKA